MSRFVARLHLAVLDHPPYLYHLSSSRLFLILQWPPALRLNLLIWCVSFYWTSCLVVLDTLPRFHASLRVFTQLWQLLYALCRHVWSPQSARGTEQHFFDKGYCRRILASSRRSLQTLEQIVRNHRSSFTWESWAWRMAIFRTQTFSTCKQHRWKISVDAKGPFSL